MLDLTDQEARVVRMALRDELVVWKGVQADIASSAVLPTDNADEMVWGITSALAKLEDTESEKWNMFAVFLLAGVAAVLFILVSGVTGFGR